MKRTLFAIFVVLILVLTSCSLGSEIQSVNEPTDSQVENNAPAANEDQVEVTPTEEVEPTPELVQPTPEPAPEKFPFQGIWFEQDRSSMLVITDETVYLHEFEVNREVYARIDQVDLEAETITVFITGILIGGKGMGYDSPILQIRYHVNGTVMEFLGQHLDFAPDEEGPVIYILDEFLNSGK